MSSGKSWKGCWTCRLRHKKCDETYPECKSCSTLLITCHYGTEKPAWMDNGPLQRDMVERFKQDIKDKAAMRRTLSYMREAGAAAEVARTQHRRSRSADVERGLRYTLPHHDRSFAAGETALSQPQDPIAGPSGSVASSSANPAGTQPSVSKTLRGCDPGFVSYYLDFFFPFLFPFYQPDMLQGGRTWLLEFVDEAEGMQAVVLALSSYLFSIVLDATEAGHEICKKIGWDKLLAEMQNTFKRLRSEIPKLSQSLDDTTMQNSRAVRILGTIVHLQRFEIATHGFANCNTHLSAATRCFRQIMNATNSAVDDSDSKFFTFMASLGPSPWPKPYRQFQIASPDQVGFRFFLSLLVADDIIASTSLAEEPRLYEYHQGLLSGEPENGLPVDLEAVMGCQSWVMLQISEIAVLAAWKRRQVTQSNPVTQLIESGESVKNTLGVGLETIKELQDVALPAGHLGKDNSVLSLFHTWQSQPWTPADQSKIVTRVWAHAAFIYLLVTLYGWNPSHLDIRHHVEQIIDLLAHKLSGPALLRSVVWPFCVAGCLAEPNQEEIFRRQASFLQPAGLFVTVRKAVEIMEAVWSKKHAAEPGSSPYNDMADCFGATGEVLFLI